MLVTAFSQIEPALADHPFPALAAGTFVVGDFLQLARAEAILLLDAAAHALHEYRVGVQHHQRVHNSIPPS